LVLTSTATAFLLVRATKSKILKAYCCFQIEDLQFEKPSIWWPLKHNLEEGEAGKSKILSRKILSRLLQPKQAASA